MFDQEPGLRAQPTSSFPSPAQDYDRGPVSLDRALISNPAATFVLRVEGDGLRSGGVLDGDELVVDRALDPRAGHVVIVVIEGQHRVGRLLPTSQVGQHLNQMRQHGSGSGTADHEGTGRGPWSGADGWFLATDDLVLPIPSGSVFFGVARYAIHHLRADLPAPMPPGGSARRADRPRGIAGKAGSLTATGAGARGPGGDAA